MKHKRLVTLLGSICLILVLAAMPFLAACPAPAPAPAPAPQKMYKIGMSQIITHPVLDDMREGCIKALAEEGFVDGENVEYDFENPEGDLSVAKAIADKFVSEPKDLIISFTTPCTQAMCAAAEGSDIPIVFIAVTDPVLAGIVQSWENPCFPGAHITGVSDYVPVRPQLEIIKEICPDAEVVGVVYNAGDESNTRTVNEFKSLLPEFGLDVIEANVSTTADVHTAAMSLVDRVDIMWFPMCNTVMAAVEALVGVCEEYDIPLFTAAIPAVERGGISAVSATLEAIGGMGGHMAARVLRGEDPCSIPATTAEATEIYLNPGAAERMGVTIPQSLLDKAYEIWNGQEWEEVGH